MQRLANEPRPGWKDRIAEQGLIYWETELPDGEKVSYWNEDHHYTLTTAEVYEFEASVRVMLGEMLVAVGDHILERNMFGTLGIPSWAEWRIRETWESEPPMVYGRFDFAYGPDGVPKLLEFNADTPTSLVETAIQWFWLEDVFPGYDQWNMVHELLVARWKELADDDRLPGDVVHMAYTEAETSGEDFMTVSYMAEIARQAGVRTKLLPIEKIANTRDGFVDPDREPIRTCFKLYPWEWMIHEDFGNAAMSQMGAKRHETTWIEPVWKMLWSNKAILPILWELYEGHPNLLPAFFDHRLDDGSLDPAIAEQVGPSYVRKPLLAREGANTVIVLDGDEAETGPDQGYGQEGFVVQSFTDLGDHDGWHPVFGVWAVDMEPAGLGIRESTSLVTNNLSRFAPHTIID